MAIRRRKDEDVPRDERTALPSLRDLGGTAPTGSDDAERYGAWAQRLGAKRQVAQASIRDASLQGRPAEPAPSYWSEDILFMDAASTEELQRVTDPSPEQLRAFFRVLEVPDDASLPEITQSYRVLAKQHHPDRFVEAEESVRAHHEERMREINLAHRALSRLVAGRDAPDDGGDKDADAAPAAR